MLGGAAFDDELCVADGYHHEAKTDQRVARALQLAAEGCELHFFQLQRAVSKHRFHFRLRLRIHLRLFRSHQRAATTRSDSARWWTPLTTRPRFVPSSTRLYPCRRLRR